MSLCGQVPIQGPHCMHYPTPRTEQSGSPSPLTLGSSLLTPHIQSWSGMSSIAPNLASPGRSACSCGSLCFLLGQQGFFMIGIHLSSQCRIACSGSLGGGLTTHPNPAFLQVCANHPFHYCLRHSSAFGHASSQLHVYLQVPVFGGDIQPPSKTAQSCQWIGKLLGFPWLGLLGRPKLQAPCGLCWGMFAGMNE